MRKIFLAIILILLCAQSGLAQADHLVPVKSIFDSRDVHVDYYARLRKILYAGLSNCPEVRLLILPSFSPEEMFEIAFDEQSNSYYLVYQQCEIEVWENKNCDDIRPVTYKKRISEEYMNLVKELFVAAIQKTRFPDPFEEIRGLDGENYYFSASNYGLKTGEVWSPNKGSKMDRLVKICTQIIELAKKNGEEIKFDMKLQEEIKQLINDIKGV